MSLSSLAQRASLAAAVVALAASAAWGQELVVNGGFEEFSTCPPALGQVDGHVDDWFRTGLGSTDYHNACGFSTRPSRTGDGHLGLIPFDSSDNYREYATGTLSAPLVAGETYSVELWVVLSDGRLHAIREISAWFTDTRPTFTGSAPPSGITPQVTHSGDVLESTTEWMPIRESFVAAGGERFITIGNFLTDAETTTVFFGCCGQHGAYYHVDDVSVTPSQASPKLEVACARVGDRCAENPALDGNGAVDLGEELDLEIALTNSGSIGMTGYTALLDVGGDAGAEVLSPAGGLIEVASIAVGETALVPVTLRIPRGDEGGSCGSLVDLTLRDQSVDGGFGFPDDDLNGCDTDVDGCGDCSATCLHRADVTTLVPHSPPRSEVYAPRGADDVALTAGPLACPFADGDLEPDPSALTDGVPLVLYQVDEPVDSLRLEKAGTTIRFRF